jgi:hypothetical protein
VWGYKSRVKLDMEEAVELWNVSNVESCWQVALLVRYIGHETMISDKNKEDDQRYPSGHDVLWCHIIRRSQCTASKVNH